MCRNVLWVWALLLLVQVSSGNTILTDDFSGSHPGSWTVWTNATYGWAWPNDEAYCYAAQNGGNYYYPAGLSCYMERRANLTGYDKAYLTFDYVVDSELNKDFLRVKVTDGLGTWTQVFSASGTAQHMTYSRKTLNLSSFAGKSNVTIRFEFTSDSTGGYPDYNGAYIDNVCLAAQNTDTNPTHCTVSLQRVSNTHKTACDYSLPSVTNPKADQSFIYPHLYIENNNCFPVQVRLRMGWTCTAIDETTTTTWYPYTIQPGSCASFYEDACSDDYYGIPLWYVGNYTVEYEVEETVANSTGSWTPIGSTETFTVQDIAPSVDTVIVSDDTPEPGEVITVTATVKDAAQYGGAWSDGEKGGTFSPSSVSFEEDWGYEHTQTTSYTVPDVAGQSITITFTATNIHGSDSDDDSLSVKDLHQLNLFVNPEGAGTVTTDSPPPYYEGDVVQLTAVAANAEWVFDHWEGGATGSANPLSVTMSSSKDISAVFVHPLVLLTTEVSPAGGGSISVTPEQTNYEWGTPVAVCALANQGYEFSQWEVDLSGTSACNTVDMYGDKTVRAVFTLIPSNLTWDIVPEGSGTLEFNPPIEEYPGGYPYGMEVKVTAKPVDYWMLDYWQGELAGTAATQQLIMDSDKHIQANFRKLKNVLCLKLDQQEARLSGIFKVNLDIINAQNLGAHDITVLYDPNVAEVLTVDEGDFLSEGGVISTLWMEPTIDSDGGRIAGMANVRFGAGSISGDGTLASIRFIERSGRIYSYASQVDVDVEHASLSDQYGVQLLSEGTRGNRVEFLNKVPSDTDDDRIVSFTDFSILATRWLDRDCAFVSDWCDSLDLTKDGQIDSADLCIIADQWLRTSPVNEMAFISGGSFEMGDSVGDGDIWELPVHLVTLDPFYIGRYEITNAQYCVFLNSALSEGLIVVDPNGVVIQVGSGTSYPYCDTCLSSMDSQISWNGSGCEVRTKSGRTMSNNPMVMVSWYGAAAYCNWRSQQEGKEQCYNLTTWELIPGAKGYRLPTEAEWEYAARGGLPGKRFPWGDTVSHTQANYYSDWSSGVPYYSYDKSHTSLYHPLWDDGVSPRTSPAGFFDGSLKYRISYNWPSSATSYQTSSGANGYDLYDMAGNVWEWCYDRFGGYLAEPQTNPTGQKQVTNWRVARGGSWSSDAYNCRVAHRVVGYPGDIYRNCGFRLALDSGLKLLTISTSLGGHVLTPGEGDFEYPMGTVVSIEAQAAPNCTFQCWTGTAVDLGMVADPMSSCTTVMMNDSYTLVAEFVVENTLLPSPMAYWYFNEGTGAIAHDRSGNEHDGTIYGATWAEGIFASALDFNGSSDYVSTDVGNGMTFDGITMSAWVYTEDTTDASGIICSRNGTNYGALSLGLGNQTPCFMIQGKGLAQSSNGTIAKNQWVMLTGTYDGTTFRVYVDGKPQGTGTGTGSWAPGANFDIGRDNWATSELGRWFDGRIDEVRIYNRALSETEVQKLHLEDSLKVGLKAYYKLDETSGVVTDETGSNPGTNNGATTGVAGVNGSAYYFDGLNDYITGTPSMTDSQGSIFAWIKPDSCTYNMIYQVVATEDNHDFLFFDYRDHEGSQVLDFYINTYNTKLRQLRYTNAENNLDLTDGNWHLVGMTHDGSSYKFYVDGVRLTNQVYNYGSANDRWFDNLNFADLDEWNIGRNNRKNESNGYFDGRIDDVRIYNRALSEGEVQSLYLEHSIGWISIDEAGFGGQMSEYEITSTQYVQYLNAALVTGDVVVNGDYVKGASGPYSGQNYYYLAGAGISNYGATNGGAARINYTGSSFTVDDGFGGHPVTYVSWYGAMAFCNYYGWRLPTELEWQAVADYDGSYIYGCGTSIDSSAANYRYSAHPDGTTTVGAFGAYGYEMCDMAGNVREWTSTVSGDSRCINRGGSWGGEASGCTVSSQDLQYPDNVAAGLGFRVCR